MKRFSAPPSVYADPTRPPDDDDSDASSLSDGSKKVKTAQSFESLFNSESLSDIVLDINGGEYVFHAHKMIVGLKSERLAALITNAIATTAPPSLTLTPSERDTTTISTTPNKPVLHLREPDACSAVFSRFLYFIYSGAVWLHRDYVVPLFQLAVKYGVSALAAHCENYIVQILNKMLHIDASLPLTQSLQIISVCDLYEDPGYRDETQKAAFKVLCKRFADFSRTERWITASWTTVRDLLHSDDCISEENLILVSATDWMKRNKLQDKARIQEILSSIRYPRLPRRVLYHLHATSSFKKFPPVQDLIEAAIRYHCFKDVPEAQADFNGLQYRSRGCGSNNNNNNNNNNDINHDYISCSNNNNNDYNGNNSNRNNNNRHTSMCGVENGDNNNSPPLDIDLESTNNNNNNNNNNNMLPHPHPHQPSASSSSSTSPEEINSISFPGEFNSVATATLLPTLTLSPSRNGIGGERGGGGGGEEGTRCHQNHHHNHHHHLLHHHHRSECQHPGSLLNNDEDNNHDDDIRLPSFTTTTTPSTNPPHSSSSTSSFATAPTLPMRHHRSRSEDRHHNSSPPTRDHRVTSGPRHRRHHPHHHHHHHHNHSASTQPPSSSSSSYSLSSASNTTTSHLSPHRRHLLPSFEPPAISSFHSPCSPVATVQPLVILQRGRRSEDEELIDDDGDNNDNEENNIVSGHGAPLRNLLGEQTADVTIPPPFSSSSNNVSTATTTHHNNSGGGASSNSNTSSSNNNTNTITNNDFDFDNNNVICHSLIRKS